MVTKKQKKILIGGIIGSVILALIAYLVITSTLPLDNGFIKVRLYDANGNPISNSLSVVNGVPGIGYIDLTVTALNNGSLPLSCTLISATPTQFDSAMPKTTKAVPITGTKQASWTSNLIAVNSFEGGASPDVFSATVRCSYNSGGQEVFLPDKSGSISLLITPDGTGSFQVQVNQGGSGSEYCGDGICQSSETSTSCPGDCAVIPNVHFRTSDLSYVSGQAIAYTDTCGNTLGRFGYSSQTCWTVTDATCPVRSGYTLKMSGIPGKPSWGSAGSGCLYTKDADSTEVDIAFKVASSGSMCTVTGQWATIVYKSTDSDASKVSNSAQSFDSSKEDSC